MNWNNWNSYYCKRFFQLWSMIHQLVQCDYFWCLIMKSQPIPTLFLKMFHFYPHPIKIFNINFLLAHFERWIKSQKRQNFFELLLRKNHNPPLQNVLYLAEWGWGLWLSQFQICPYPPPPGHLHCFKTFGQIPHPPATLQKLSHSSNPLISY